MTSAAGGRAGGRPPGGEERPHSAGLQATAAHVNKSPPNVRMETSDARASRWLPSSGRVWRVPEAGCAHDKRWKNMVARLRLTAMTSTSSCRSWHQSCNTHADTHTHIIIITSINNIVSENLNTQQRHLLD